MRLLALDNDARMRRMLAGAIMAIAGILAPSTGADAATILGTSYHDHGTTSCQNAIGCSLSDFTAIPAGKTVVITRVSCSIGMTSAGFNSLSIGRKPTNNNPLTLGVPLHYLDPISLVGEGAGVNRYQVNAATLLTFKGPTQLAVRLFALETNTLIGMTCAITGTIS